MLNNICSLGPYVLRDKNSKSLKNSRFNSTPLSINNLCNTTCVFNIVRQCVHLRICRAVASRTNTASFGLPPSAHNASKNLTCFSFGGKSSKFVALTKAVCASANSFGTDAAATFACYNPHNTNQTFCRQYNRSRLPHPKKRTSRTNARARMLSYARFDHPTRAVARRPRAPTPRIRAPSPHSRARAHPSPANPPTRTHLAVIPQRRFDIPMLISATPYASRRVHLLHHRARHARGFFLQPYRHRPNRVVASRACE